MVKYARFPQLLAGRADSLHRSQVRRRGFWLHCNRRRHYQRQDLLRMPLLVKSPLVFAWSNFAQANSGDSRTVLGVKGRAKPLSFDHKPQNEGQILRADCATALTSHSREGSYPSCRWIRRFRARQRQPRTVACHWRLRVQEERGSSPGAADSDCLPRRRDPRHQRRRRVPCRCLRRSVSLLG